MLHSVHAKQLQLEKGKSRVGSDGVTGWFCLPSKGGVGWEKEQGEVI